MNILIVQLFSFWVLLIRNDYLEVAPYIYMGGGLTNSTHSYHLQDLVEVQKSFFSPRCFPLNQIWQPQASTTKSAVTRYIYIWIFVVLTNSNSMTQNQGIGKKFNVSRYFQKSRQIGMNFS